MKAPRLTNAEMAFVANAGQLRRINALHQRFLLPYGDPGDNWTHEVEGCGGEYVVAKHFGVFWHAVNWTGGQRLGDAGDLQVRQTRYPNGHLIVHDEDLQNFPAADVVLVTGVMPDFEMVGRMPVRDAVQSCYWNAHADRPAYFVPQRDLQPIEPAPNGAQLGLLDGRA